MGLIKPHSKVLLITAVFSRYSEGFEWARDKLSGSWGSIALESEVFDFNFTKFYEPTMGADLRKCFFAFERLIDPADLVDVKHQTNAWEGEYQQQSDWPEERPLNLDPGYLTEAKLVLATTKDRDHRLYLDRGIFAEGTLFFHHGKWETRPWTYPDYQREDYHAFFDKCRQYLRGR